MICSYNIWEEKQSFIFFQKINRAIVRIIMKPCFSQNLSLFRMCKFIQSLINPDTRKKPDICNFNNKWHIYDIHVFVKWTYFKKHFLQTTKKKKKKNKKNN